LTLARTIFLHSKRYRNIYGAVIHYCQDENLNNFILTLAHLYKSARLWNTIWCPSRFWESKTAGLLGKARICEIQKI